MRKRKKIPMAVLKIPGPYMSHTYYSKLGAFLYVLLFHILQLCPPDIFTCFNFIQSLHFETCEHKCFATTVRSQNVIRDVVIIKIPALSFRIIVDQTWIKALKNTMVFVPICIHWMILYDLYVIACYSVYKLGN